MTIDYWESERARATIDASGLKILKDDSQPGRFCVKMWRPKAIKPYVNYYYKSAEQRDKYVTEQIANMAAHTERKEKYKAERKGTKAQAELVQVGFIFVCSWGYDQTNIDFYQVIEKKGQYVTLREIGCNSLASPGFSPMSDHRMAIKDSFRADAKPFRKKLQFYGGKPYVTMTSYSSAHIWDGQKEYCSWYA